MIRLSAADVQNAAHPNQKSEGEMIPRGKASEADAISVTPVVVFPQ